jgi:periplasmic protein TonB
METERRWAMFESLVEIRRERALARKAWTFPVSLAFHATLVTLLVLYSIFARDALLAPCNVFMTAPVDFLPVELGTPDGGQTAEDRPQEPEAAPPQNDANALTEPGRDADADEVSEVVFEREPLSSAGTPGHGSPGPKGDPNGIPGGKPPDRPTTNAEPKTASREVLIEAGLVSALKVVRSPQPAYPPSFVSLGITGRVEVELVVDESGRVESVRVVSATNPVFAEAAVAAAKAWLFQPPVSKAGARVAVFKRVTFNFSLR